MRCTTASLMTRLVRRFCAVAFAFAFSFFVVVSSHADGLSPTSAEAVTALNGPNPAQNLKNGGWSFRPGPDAGSWNAMKADGLNHTRIIRFDRGTPLPNPAWAGNVDHFHNVVVPNDQLDNYFAKKTNGTPYDANGEIIKGNGDAAKERSHIRAKTGQAALSNESLPPETLREMQKVTDAKAQEAASNLDRVKADQSKLPPGQRDAAKVDAARDAARTAAEDASEMRQRAANAGNPGKPANGPAPTGPAARTPGSAPGSKIAPPEPCVRPTAPPRLMSRAPVLPEPVANVPRMPANEPVVPRAPAAPPAGQSGGGKTPRGGGRGVGGMSGPAIGLATTLGAEPAADWLFPGAAKNRDKRLQREAEDREAAYQDARVECWSKGLGVKFKSHDEVQEYLRQNGGTYIDFKKCTIDPNRYPDGTEKIGFPADLSFGLAPDNYKGLLENIFDQVQGRSIHRKPLTPSGEKNFIDMLKQPGGEERVRRLLANAAPAQEAMQKSFKDALGKDPTPEQMAAATRILASGGGLGDVANRVNRVNSAYNDVLGRKPDDGGFPEWLQFARDERALRAAFAASPEFTNTTQAKVKSALGRDATPEEMQSFSTWFSDGTMKNQTDFDAYLGNLKAAGVR